MKTKLLHRERLSGPRMVDIVRDRMIKTGLSTRQLANRYGVSKSFIDDIIHDRHCPSADACQHMYEDLTGLPLMLLEKNRIQK